MKMDHIVKEIFGTLPDGRAVTAYTLTRGDITAKILDLGTTVADVRVAGVSVVRGYDTLDSYLQQRVILRLTERSTPFSAITARTICTAARSGSTNGSGVPRYTTETSRRCCSHMCRPTARRATPEI